MTGLTFYLNGAGDLKNVYCQYYANDGRLQMSISLKVDADKFKTGKLPKEQASVVRRLQTIIDTYEADTRLSGRQTRKEDVAALVLEAIGKGKRQVKQRESFAEFFARYLEGVESGAILNDGKRYSRSYIGTANAVLKILSKVKIGEIPIDLITEEDLRQYATDITGLKRKSKRTYAKNTIAAYYEFTRTFLVEGSRLGWHKAGQGFGTRIGRDSIEHAVYLTEDEMRAIMDLELTGDEAAWRDAFILGCMLGLRHSDLSRLTPAHRSGNLVNINTTKTGKNVWVPLSAWARQIWDKYDGNLKVAKLTPMNLFVKKWGKNAGIDKPVQFSRTEGGKTVEKWVKKYQLLGTHSMRRTFATNAFLAKVPEASIMKVTGHKSSANFLKYIRVTEEEHATILLEHPHFK